MTGEKPDLNRKASESSEEEGQIQLPLDIVMKIEEL
jgi:hypothetical protein